MPTKIGTHPKRKTDEPSLATEIIRMLRRRGEILTQFDGDTEAQDELIYQYLAERYGLGYLLQSTRCEIAPDGSAQIIRNVKIEAYSEVASIDSFISIPEEDPKDILQAISPGRLKTFDTGTIHQLAWQRPKRIAGKISAKISITPPLKSGEILQYQVLDVNFPTDFFAIDKTAAEIAARENSLDYWGWQITRPTKKLVLEVKFPFGQRPSDPKIGIRYALTPGVADEHYPPKVLADLENSEINVNEIDDSINKEFDYPVFNMIYMLYWNPKVKEESHNLVVHHKISPETETLNSPILIVTTNKVETRAVLKAFSTTAKKSRKQIAGKIHYLLTAINHTPIYMVQCEQGTSTAGGALVTIQDAINHLDPKSVILCGIAFGLRKESQKMGDILISKQLTSYEPAKVDRDHGVMQRGDRVTASAKLINQCRSEEVDWKGPKLHFGNMLSGEKLVNDPTFCEQLLKIEPEAIGGEMEGSGLYVAANDANVNWIMIKAICDWADGNKDDTAQVSAARNAATFVHRVLAHNA